MLKILNALQLQEVDRYTIQKEPISSIDLMERAATKWLEQFKVILQHRITNRPIVIIAGSGNNGTEATGLYWRDFFSMKEKTSVFSMFS
jgi:NAD(P)H-hydrate epimerase